MKRPQFLLGGMALIVLCAGAAVSADITYGPLVAAEDWHLAGPGNDGFVVYDDAEGFAVELGLRARSDSSVLSHVGSTYTVTAGSTWFVDTSVCLFVDSPDSLTWTEGFATVDAGSPMTDPDSDDEANFSVHHALGLYVDGALFMDLKSLAASWAGNNGCEENQVVGVQYTTVDLAGLAPGDHQFSLRISSIVKDVDMTVKVTPVPVPGAIFLAMFGLGTAGMKLRKHS